MRYYLDTCIWIDFLEERSESVVKKVFEILLNHDLVVSEIVLVELERHTSSVNLSGLKNINLINSSDIQRKKAFDISKERNIPFGDALHAIIAKENKAVLLTRDKHFIKLRDVVEVELL